MSTDDMVVIQGCDECNGRGTIEPRWVQPVPASVTPLSRRCPKCNGKGWVQNT